MTKGDGMDKKAIFISQPMKGKSRNAIERERKMILDNVPSLLDIEYIVEIPMMSELVAMMNSPAHCLGSSIQDMSNADLVVFAPGWRDARGCAIEHAVCMLYRIPFAEIGNDGNEYFLIKTENFERGLDA